jgi:hypothetical protein
MVDGVHSSGRAAEGRIRFCYGHISSYAFGGSVADESLSLEADMSIVIAV